MGHGKKSILGKEEVRARGVPWQEAAGEGGEVRWREGVL